MCQTRATKYMVSLGLNYRKKYLQSNHASSAITFNKNAHTFHNHSKVYITLYQSLSRFYKVFPVGSSVHTVVSA